MHGILDTKYIRFLKNDQIAKYECQILLFGPNYSNSQIIQIIRDNTGLNHHSQHRVDECVAVEIHTVHREAVVAQVDHSPVDIIDLKTYSLMS